VAAVVEAIVAAIAAPAVPPEPIPTAIDQVAVVEIPNNAAPPPG
jgi:hypothetical protein